MPEATNVKISGDSQDVLLWDAIKYTRHEHLRALIKELAQTQPDAKEKIASSLLVACSDVFPGTYQTLNGDEVGAAAKMRSLPVGALITEDTHINLNGKRTSADDGLLKPAKVLTVKKTKRYENCIQCSKSFDVVANNDKACQWHNGDWECDEDWADWDDNYWQNSREKALDEYPEGVIWDCCDARGDEDKYCQIGPHRVHHQRHN